MTSRIPTRIFQKSLQPLRHIARPRTLPLSQALITKRQTRKATIGPDYPLPSSLEILRPALFRELLASNHSTQQSLPLITPLGKAHMLPVGWVKTDILADVVKVIKDNALEGMENATLHVFRVGYDGVDVVETRICVSLECAIADEEIKKCAGDMIVAISEVVPKEWSEEQ
ncbi:hypothetical protein HYALB_00009488 [Hymenoscyphus albidus]|uniref:Uncharacterized protein n=1 Tax=Hymenoscyphus albidus TaxID=595503 RepID=A0A9N9M017_9HELO|nr:hypothetical protein HYALB_00009488 [Hymenoscyphus albidus]